MLLENTLLGKEDYKKHGAELGAKSYVVRRDGRGAKLPKWDRWAEQIQSTYYRITEEYGEERTWTMPAEEWLGENYSIVQAQLTALSQAAIKSGWGLFPVVELPPDKEKMYRVFHVSREIVEHTDGQVDEAAIVEFLESYQQYAPLTTQELAHLGHFIQFALLERIAWICHVADQMEREREEAKSLYERFQRYWKAGEAESRREISRALELWLAGVGELTPILAETVLHHAASVNEDTEALRSLFERKLAGRGTTLDDMIGEEHRLRAALGVSMGNAILSLKQIPSLDWAKLFSKLSILEHILEEDPAGVYARMSPDSKGLYVQRVDRLAHQWKCAPEALAFAGIELATSGEPGKARHVGYYFWEPGLRKLQKKMRHSLVPLSASGWRFGYFSLWAILSAILVFVPLVFLVRNLSKEYSSISAHLALFFLLVPGLVLLLADSAGKLVQRIFTGKYPPRVLPSMDFREGIPPENRVMVILPGLLSDPDRTEELLLQLEKGAYANQDPNICFALIGDFRDGPNRREPSDEAIVERGLSVVARMNRRYRETVGEEGEKFYFYYRERTWYEKEAVWMGWEKKRGAILEWNRLLLGREEGVWKGSRDPRQIPHIYAVLTIDADTRLPNRSVAQMVELMGHILNEPELVCYQKDHWVVRRGYGLLQPAVVPGMSRGRKSWFHRVFADEVGLDSYFSRTSDFYFDSFEEGIFTGKGMYRPEIFNLVLDGTFPDDAVLSHDLLEGSYLRTAFVSQVKLVDQFPGSLISYMKRQHRWTRGDWQLLPFMRRRFLDRQGRQRQNPLGTLSLYKMANNLVRSLLAPTAVLVFLLGGLFLPNLAFLWTLLLLLPSFLPWVLAPSGRQFVRSFLNLLFLPYEAYCMLDACIRTLWRVYHSKKHLLSWVTASDMERRVSGRLSSYCRFMWPCFVAALLRPSLLTIPWIVAPFLAYWMSRPPKESTAALPLPVGRRRALGVLSRKIWAFYEDFAGETDHFLPPDNVQFQPVYTVAHRTSPTNIGFLLVSTLLAWEMGYLSGRRLLLRLQALMDTVERLEKWHGHLYNWVDTVTLYPLEPLFVSTVDSGNWMACLLCGAAFLENMRRDEPVRAARGLLDLVNTFNEYALPDHKLPREPLEHFLEEPQASIAGFRLILERYWSYGEPLPGEPADATLWRSKLRESLEEWSGEAFEEAAVSEAKDLAARMTTMAWQMDFRPLYHKEKGLFATGYAVADHKMTNSYYDMLVSEARLTSYLAIAKGDVPVEHYFRLSRRRAKEGQGILLSWSGTAFEYLMPELFYRAFPGSLWEATLVKMLDGQRSYALMRGTPWGISESGYYQMDWNMNYKYKAFGVPGLGVKRGLEEDLVIAPYACLMAIDRMPLAVLENLDRLREAGMAGRYGFYEALDCTPDRQGVVASFMAHHLGMSYLALGNYLLDDVVRKLFTSIPLVAASEILLAEQKPAGYDRVHWSYTVTPHRRRASGGKTEPSEVFSQAEVRVVETSTGNWTGNRLPSATLLSNGRYKVFLTEDGNGYSQWGETDLCPWPMDGELRSSSGMMIYIREAESKVFWGAGRYPVVKKPDKYSVAFHPEKAVFCRLDGELETVLEICVSPEEDAELRRIRVRNHGGEDKLVELTGFVELALAQRRDWEAHPSYSNLFVTTEAVAGESLFLLARRTPLKSQQSPLFCCYSVAADRKWEGPLGFDTDLSTFLGRNGSVSSPASMELHVPLAAQQGTVLTPCFALRGRIRIPAGEEVLVNYTLGVASERSAVTTIADRFRSLRAVGRAFSLAGIRCTIEAEHLGMMPRERNAFLTALPHLVSPGPSRALYSLSLYRSMDVVRGLWRFGISGTIPLLAVFARRMEHAAFLERMARMWQFFRFRGFCLDMVILTEETTDYVHPLQEFAERLASKAMAGSSGAGGRIVVLVASELEKGNLDCLLAGSSLVLKPSALGNSPKLVAGKENLVAQMWNRRLSGACQADCAFVSQVPAPALSGDTLEFFNGYGGFSPDGCVYIILRNRPLPAPWVNCITGNQFGFLVSEVGSGAVWQGNSRENRLTPWYCRTVEDPVGEAIYIKNKKTGQFVTATPAPASLGRFYRISHGFGYSTFELPGKDGLCSQVTMFAHSTYPVKLSLLVLENRSVEDLTLQLVYYVKPVLGSSLQSAPYVIPVWDEAQQAMLLHHFRQETYGSWAAFVAASLPVTAYTGDDMAFKGVGGDLRYPAAMLPEGISISGAGGGRLPCAALENELSLRAGERKEVVYLLGQAEDEACRNAILEHCRDPYHVQQELSQVQERWKHFLQQVQVETPDKALNFMVNGWLLYQVRSCRLEGRTAYYQSGGAYGFRDQLQDVLALLYADPELARRQILLHASRQFEEGDVQHWWHPPENSGIRSRYSDDLLWLPYVTWQYVQNTGDRGILEEQVTFLSSRPLSPNEHDRYESPPSTSYTASLYEHCVRAVSQSLHFGEHGLPLMQGGDWNDGMNEVGAKGRGESVWLGWFLCAVLEAMSQMSRFLGVPNSYAEEGERLARNIEEWAWDGGWYLRAFYDDGVKMGSSTCAQCRIDSISQSWSVISGRGRPDRTSMALSSAEKHLVDYERGLIKLLTPPFRRDDAEPNPGYIGAYPPGIRENGAQYTHAAIWLAKAMLQAGRQETGYTLLQMLNPINHSLTLTEASRYKTEPYVIAADIYSDERNGGRGGWTWYTGAAGWYYRTILEDLLGFCKKGSHLLLSPFLPLGWPSYTVRYRYGSSLYRIVVQRMSSADPVRSRTPRELALQDDGGEHVVIIKVP